MCEFIKVSLRESEFFEAVDLFMCMCKHVYVGLYVCVCVCMNV